MSLLDAIKKVQPEPLPVAKESRAIVPQGDNDAADFGPAMQLCKPRERQFVLAVMSGQTFAQAARMAGYGEPNSKAETMARIGYRISHYPRVVDALTEEARKSIRALAPQAVQTVRDVMTTLDPKARLKAADMVLSRTDPTVQRIDQNVKVEVVNHDEEAVKQLRAFKASNATREFLEEWFGYGGLQKYERMLAAEDAAKPIEVEYTEVEATTQAEEDGFND
jgi:hypothetical protein